MGSDFISAKIVVETKPRAGIRLLVPLVGEDLIRCDFDPQRLRESGGYRNLDPFQTCRAFDSIRTDCGKRLRRT